MNAKVAGIGLWCNRSLRRYGKPFGWFSDAVERWGYPVMRLLSPYGWIVKAIVLGVAVIVVAHAAGEMVAGVGLAVVMLMAVLDWLSMIDKHGLAWARWFLLAYLLAAIGIAGIEQPAVVSAMLSDARLLAVLGALLGGLIMLIVFHGCATLLDLDRAEVEARKRVDRIADATGIDPAVVDRVLMEVDHEHEDDGEEWEYLATYEIHVAERKHLEQERNVRRAGRRAERAARKAAK